MHIMPVSTNFIFSVFLFFFFVELLLEYLSYRSFGVAPPLNRTHTNAQCWDNRPADQLIAAQQNKRKRRPSAIVDAHLSSATRQQTRHNWDKFLFATKYGSPSVFLLHLRRMHSATRFAPATGNIRVSGWAVSTSRTSTRSTAKKTKFWIFINEIHK